MLVALPAMWLACFRIFALFALQCRSTRLHTARTQVVWQAQVNCCMYYARKVLQILTRTADAFRACLVNGRHSDFLQTFKICVTQHLYIRMCMFMCVYACVCSCVHMHVRVHACICNAGKEQCDAVHHPAGQLYFQNFVHRHYYCCHFVITVLF